MQNWGFPKAARRGFAGPGKAVHAGARPGLKAPGNPPNPSGLQAAACRLQSFRNAFQARAFPHMQEPARNPLSRRHWSRQIRKNSPHKRRARALFLRARAGAARIRTGSRLFRRATIPPRLLKTRKRPCRQSPNRARRNSPRKPRRNFRAKAFNAAILRLQHDFRRIPPYCDGPETGAGYVECECRTLPFGNLFKHAPPVGRRRVQPLQNLLRGLRFYSRNPARQAACKTSVAQSPCPPKRHIELHAAPPLLHVAFPRPAHQHPALRPPTVRAA